MRESDLLKHIYQRAGSQSARFPQVVVGPGDDCAVVSGDAMLLTVDQVIGGVHFLPPPATSIDLIARKAIARSVSDIAAMGGSVRGGWGLATGCLPPGFADGRELTDALHRWAEHWGFPIVGGDIAAGPANAPLMLTVTIGGVPHRERGPVLRAGAKPGDLVWVTGRLGGSFSDARGGRHLTFEPRLTEAAWLCNMLGTDLHAMMDLSDGLGRDAGRMAEASAAKFELRGEAIPMHAEAKGLMAAIGDGEDYELLFTAAGSRRLPAACPTGTPLTCIGRVVGGNGCVLIADGAEIDASALGFDHGPAKDDA